MMHKAGVLTSFNSDSAELHRRMNTEAAKAIKYGGLSETEALNFVTLNPAKQLRIDQRVGSLEVGKDADFVIWSGHPLSTMTRAEQTWIEGRRYFDITQDQARRASAQAERERLLAKALPVRMTQLSAGGPGGGGGASGGAVAPSMPLFATGAAGQFAAEAALLHLFSHERAFRSSYNGLNAWYECTEDAR